jgi:hypothetical protein
MVMESWTISSTSLSDLRHLFWKHSQNGKVITALRARNP